MLQSTQDRKGKIMPSGEPKTERIRLKERLLGELYLNFIEHIHAQPADISLIDAALYALVIANQERGVETHAQMVPEYFRQSPATVSRKLNKLTKRGYLKRTLRNRVYYYSIPEENDDEYLVDETGKPIVNELFEKIIETINKAVEN